MLKVAPIFVKHNISNSSLVPVLSLLCHYDLKLTKDVLISGQIKIFSLYSGASNHDRFADYPDSNYLLFRQSIMLKSAPNMEFNFNPFITFREKKKVLVTES